MNEDKVKKDLEEIETINTELDHRVSNLIAENEHLNQTYKQLYESIKPTRTRLDCNNSKNELRKLKGKDLAENIVCKHTIDPGMLKINVEYLNPRLLNNMSVHSNYLKHTQEEAAIIREIVEHGKSQNPLNESLDSAYKYTKQVQELLIIVRQTCPSIDNSSEKLVALTPKNKDKRVRFTETVTSSGNTNTKTSSSSNLVSNKPMLSSTGVEPSTSASRSQPSGNTKKSKIQRTPSSTQKNKVEVHPRTVKSSLRDKNFFVEPKGNENVQHSKHNANSDPLCVKCNGYILSDNHNLCVLDFINDVNAHTKSKSVKTSSKRKVWKPTGKVFTNIGYTWRPTGQTFTIVGNACPLTRITTTAEVPLRKPTALESDTPKPVVTLVYSRKPRKSKTNVPVSKPKIIKSISANKKEPSKSWGSIVSDVPSSSLDECRSSKLFSARHGLVRGLLKLKFEKDHLCFVCAMGKIKKKPHKPKSEDTNQEKLYLLHMDLCGPMRVASVNGKKYILVIVDDYSRFTWVKCLRLKDEAPDFIIKFLKMIQTLREYYEKVGISHETSVARSPQQNVATACYTQNRSIICLRHGKTPYELLHDKLPDLLFFHVFGALCYPSNDSENLGKLQPKADIGIFISYAPTKKAFRIYNRRTRRIIETIHVDFDELTAMASEHSSLGPALHEMTPATISSGLMPNPPPSTLFIPPLRTD
ncbi:retrovirus-related pol polyprotein from transposon TNT 1-94 [Tanacetum coccineum]